MAIKYIHNEKEEHLEFTGRGIELIADISWLVRRVYMMMRQKDPVAAEGIKNLLMKVIGSADSPTWE